MGEYDRAIATATRLIAKKGRVVDWSKATAAEPEPGDKPWKPQPSDGPADEPFKPKVVFFPPGEGSRATLQQITGTEVPTASEYGLLAGSEPFTPEQGDIVMRDGIQLAVVGVATLRPAEDAVLHTVWFLQ
jgi:hypothetical protein